MRSESRFSRRATDLSLNKNETMLRAKIRLQQQQIMRLQSGMNVFAQLEEKSRQLPSPVKVNCGHQQQLRTLSLKVSGLQHDKQRLLSRQNQLESQLRECSSREKHLRESMRNLEEQIKELDIQMNHLSLENRELSLQNQALEEEKTALGDKLTRAQQKLKEIVQQVERIDHHVLVKISHKEKLTIVKLADYDALKAELFKLKLKLAEFQSNQKWQKEQQDWQKRKNKMQLGRQCKDIGQQIVRLKRNIDHNLGNADSQYTESFLSKYNDVKKALDKLAS